MVTNTLHTRPTEPYNSVILRRTATDAGPRLVIGLHDQRLARYGETLRLPRKEFNMAVVLLSASGRLVSHDELFDALYGDREDGGPDEKIIAIMLCRLRKKLVQVGVRIETHHGQGFRACINGAPHQPHRTLDQVRTAWREETKQL